MVVLFVSLLNTLVRHAAARPLAAGCVNRWVGRWVEKEEAFCLSFCRGARDAVGVEAFCLSVCRDARDAVGTL